MKTCSLGRCDGQLLPRPTEALAKKRKAGDGLIRQRADGRWEGRYVVGYDDHGYPKTKAVFGKSKRECAEKLAALKTQLGGIPSDKLRPEMRFADWLDHWYEAHCKPNIRTSTQSGYEDRIRLHIKPELGEIPLNRLTQNDLQQFYARLKKSGRKARTEYYGEGLSDRMVRMCHATCRSALQRAVQDGLIRTNPAEGCKLPPKKAREMQVLARDELQRFLIQAQAEGYYELFLLDLATGLRRGELLALQWDDLDFETGILTISKQVSLVRGKIVMSVLKTKSSIRKLVLPPAVVQVLREYRKSVHSRWMFPSPVLEDLPLNPGSVYDRLQLILEHANCKQVRFHDLRHTFATLALQNGMDVKTLSAMLGHVSAATTLDIYTHSTSDMQHAAARKIDCGIGKAELPDEPAPQANTPAIVDFQPYMGKVRKPGTGCISQINDHLFEGRYPKTKAVFGKSKRECVEKLAALKTQLGGIPSDKLRPEMRFADWLDYWYETHCKPNIRTSTQSGYEDRIRLHIKPELGEIPLNRLTQNDLQQFYARLKKSGRKTRTEYYGEGLSDRMVRMCHATCRSALQRAVQDGLIRTNPAEGCKLPPKKAREMQVLARDELQRFLIQAQAEGYYELFLLDLATGLRRGELLALQWDDLDFETGVLTISKQVSLVRCKIVMSVPKTKSSIRKLVLPPAVVQVLKEYRESNHSRWMFPSPVLEDLPLNPGSVYDRLQLILEHASCKQVRFHDLRHMFATLALQNGMDVKTLSAMLGHVSAATTLDIYTHSTSDMQHAAARKIDCGIGKAELPDEPAPQANAPAIVDFQPYMGKVRKPGTGCISQINDHLFEGRYSPTWVDGKKHARNVYAHTREECEEKLKVLIAEMKAELAELKRQKGDRH